MQYSHNRDAVFTKSSDELYTLINIFSEQDLLTALYDYFQKRYSLPQGVVKQGIKRSIASSYIYRKASFSKELSLGWILVSMLKHLGALFYAFIHCRKLINKGCYKLIVDGIASVIEFERFKELIDLFGKENVLIITTSEAVIARYPSYNIEAVSRLKHCDIHQVLRSLLYECMSGIWLYISLSIKLRMNLFYAVTPLVMSYIHHTSLFMMFKADFIIQERHYGTNSIKNYLFKKSGGCYSTTIQKNILQMDTMNYYIDTDILFSLGNRTADLAFEYGGRIGRVIPVGSMFMEYYWFKNPANVEKKIDVVMLGINVMNAYERLDSYSKFMDDYYESIRWLVRFKKENPSYRVVIKHHASAGRDEIEEKIISGSGVEMLARVGNSYEIAFGSRCAVTYGSTMGYELNAHGVPTFFLDPGYRCTILTDGNEQLLKGLRVASYEAFSDMVLNVLNNSDTGKTLSLNNSDDLCLNSAEVSRRIYSALMQQADQG